MTTTSRNEAPAARAALVAADCGEPQHVLGIHAAGPSLWRVVVWHPEAVAAEAVLAGAPSVVLAGAPSVALEPTEAPAPVAPDGMLPLDLPEDAASRLKDLKSRVTTTRAAEAEAETEAEAPAAADTADPERIRSSIKQLEVLLERLEADPG